MTRPHEDVMAKPERGGDVSDKRWKKHTEIVEHPPGEPVEFRRKDGSLLAIVQIGRSFAVTTTLRREPGDKTTEVSGPDEHVK